MMTATFHLVRHAAHALVNHVLVGRMEGVRLSDEGHEQARQLAAHPLLRTAKRVISSPRERARETAGYIAALSGVVVETALELDEIEVGAWTGCSFDDLAADARWRTWNAARGSARPPGGESMGELQARIVGFLDGLRTRSDAGAVLVTHAEVIRAALLHYLARGLDAFATVEVAPASISTLVCHARGVRIAAINVR